MYKTILVDDSNTITQGLLQLIPWDEMGLEVAGTFRNGADAMEFLKENTDVAIVFTDIKMPVMDGLSLIKAARKSGINSHFVCLSSYDEYPLVREAFVLGAEDYLLKMEIEPDKVKALCEKLISKIAEESRQTVETEAASDTDNHIINTVLQLIENEFSKELNLKILSSQVGISSGYLGQLFNKSMGMSFNDYLNNRRVKEASNMLRSGEYKIYEIAESCGYNNVEHFSRIFKKITGTSPKSW